MDRTLRVDKPKKFQRLLCFFNLYHSFHYWTHNRKGEEYAHIRKCTCCNKLQRQTWYQTGYGDIERPWRKVNSNLVEEPKIILNKYLKCKN